MRLGDDRHLGYGDPDVMIDPRVGPCAITRSIHETGMQRVYVTEHTALKPCRAVKLLSPRLTENASFVRRRVNPGRAVSKLHHRHLSYPLQVHGVGKLPRSAWSRMLDHLDGYTPGACLATHTGPVPAHAIFHCEIGDDRAVAREREARPGER